MLVLRFLKKPVAVFARLPRTIWGAVVEMVWGWRLRFEALQARRPHRSFRPTKRRDYVRTLSLPGYWRFTAQVMRLLWQVRRAAGWLLVLYALAYAVLVGMVSERSLSALRDALDTAKQTAYGDPGIGTVGDAALLLVAGLGGNLNPVQNETGQVYAILLGTLLWLAVVWLLRAKLAGRTVSLREAIYNSGAPIVPTIIVGIVLTVQLLPAGIGVLFLGAAINTGFISMGVGGMLVGVGAVLAIILSVFWITSTLLALVMVTLPGVYPMRALRLAGDMVTSRRVRILLRWAWLALLLVVVWMGVMIPAVLLDGWLKVVWPGLSQVPIVPATLLAISTLELAFGAAYVYLLYRKVVDSDAAA